MSDHDEHDKDEKKEEKKQPVSVPVSTAVKTAKVPEPVYQWPGPMPELPKLYVTKYALGEMTNEVLAHPKTETAWGLYGFSYPKSIFVVGVIRPVLGEVVRGYANAEAGGQEMANAMRWLYANEKAINGMAKEGQGKFCFLYKGHSHHTLGYSQYSGTDHQSIFEAVKSDGMKVAIGPLALIKQNGVRYSRTWGDEVVCSRHSSVNFIFYMMTKEMVAAGYTDAVKVKPTLVETVRTLMVPPLGWEFAHDDDFKEQLRHLKSWGCDVVINHIDANGKPPLEIQFVINNTAFRQTLIITTDWNYPEVAPRIQLLPKPGTVMTMSEANRISAMKWWNKGDDFIDIIGRMIVKGGLI